jgi:multimeric flavodoxin WrbA
MKITSFNGSPKADRSNTHLMVEALLAGARAAGAEVENVFLARKTIRPCTACLACWSKTPGVCAQRDDMEELLSKVIASDVVVFATPLFVDNVSGIMKNFMDRLVPITRPHWEKDENGECRHPMRHGRPSKIVALSNNGFPQQVHFQVLRLLFRRLARTMHAELVAEVYRDGGGLLTMPVAAPAVARYREVLERAGREIVERSALSPETMAWLEQPLVRSTTLVDDLVKMVNDSYDRRDGLAAGR